MSTTQQEQTRAAASQEYLLEMRGITKAFAGVQALKGVDFYVRPGTVHALMGENGAGKSTLMKCLFGIYHKDEGTIKLRGQEVNFQSPHEALLNGISMVHQELEQVPERSVMENVWLGRFPKKFGLIDTAKMVKDTEAVLATLGGEVKIDPRARLSSLTVSKRQMVDIAKAVSYNCDIIALDEPTSSLNEKEVDILMEIIDGLRRQGKGIIYISHKMEEIFRIADDITVMRDGALIKTMRAAETNVDEVIRLMVGRELTDRFPPKQGTIGKEILVVKDLNDLGHHIHDISFDLHEGEVLGIAGLLGAGRTELLETLFGARTRESGTVTLKGKEIRNKSTAEAIKNGFALCKPAGNPKAGNPIAKTPPCRRLSVRPTIGTDIGNPSAAQKRPARKPGRNPQQPSKRAAKRTHRRKPLRRELPNSPKTGSKSGSASDNPPATKKGRTGPRSEKTEIKHQTGSPAEAGRSSAGDLAIVKLKVAPSP